MSILSHLNLRAASRLLLTVGAATMMSVHILINIGMNIGIMPVTGLSLPFLSYGGSFVLSCFIVFGLVQSVHCHTKHSGAEQDSENPERAEAKSRRAEFPA